MGSLSAARDSGHCSVNFVLLGTKAFLDEAVEEFKSAAFGWRIKGKGGSG